MKKKIIGLCLSLLTTFVVSTGVFATIAEPAVEFYQISPPTTTAQYPIFIYQKDTTGWKQIGYVADPSITVYAGPFDIQGKTGTPPTITFKVVSAVLSADETSVIGWSGGCIFSVTGKTIALSAQEPCISKGAEIIGINEDSSTYGSNFYSISMASLALPTMTTASDYPTAYHLPQYQKNTRTVSFYNATQYPTIGLYNTKISETTYVTSGTATTKHYPGNAEIESYVWKMGGGGTSGCAVGSPCWNYSGGVFKQDPLQTYGVYATTFEATYHKVTPSRVNPNISFVANGNYDLSVVNGFTFKGILTPAEPTYCSTQTPLQYANPKGDLFVYKVSPKKVMASFPRADTLGGNTYSTTILGMCNNISAQPLTQAYNSSTSSKFNYTPPTSTFLSVFSSSSTFLGCMSPCQYATHVSSLYNSKLPANQQPLQYQNFLAAYGTHNGSHNSMQDIVDQFCCSGTYAPKTNGKEACDTAGMNYPSPYPTFPPGIAVNYTNNQYGLINNSSYVRTMNGVTTPVQLQHQPPQAPLTNNNSPAVDFSVAAATNTYAYQFGDPIANVGCPGDTDFVAYVFDDTTPGNNPNVTYLTKATGIEVNNITSTAATFNWEAPEDSNATPNIQYTANVYLAGTTSLVTSCQTSTLSCGVTALSPNIAYQVQIVAQDGQLNSHSKLYNFTASDPSIVLVGPVLSIGTFSGQQVNISWTPAIDPTDTSATFSYLVNVNNGRGTVTSTGATSASITGLTADQPAQYTVTVFATETAGRNQNSVVSSNPVVFAMESISPVPSITSLTPNNAGLTVKVDWTPSTISSSDGIAYFVHFNNSVSPPLNITHSPYTYTIPSLANNTLYSIIVAACDANIPTQCVQSLPQSVCLGTCSGGQLTAPTNVAAGSVTRTGATVSWGASQDSYSGASITGYTVNVSTSADMSNAQPFNAGTALEEAVTGLTANTTYYTTVTATDTQSHVATSSPAATFKTSAGTVVLSAPALSQQGSSTVTGANVAWTAASDPDGAATFDYTVNYNSNQQDVGNALSAALTGLSPGRSYPVTITAKELSGQNVGATVTSNTVTVTTATETVSTPVVSPATGITSNSANIAWSASTENLPTQNQVNYTVAVTPAPTTGQPAAVDGAVSTTLTGLTPSTSYTVTVKGCDSVTGVCSAVSAASSPFTTQPAAETLTAPGLNPVTTVTVSTAGLSWSPSIGGGSDAINYTAHVTNVTQGGSAIPVPVGTGTTYTLTGLDPATNYAVTLMSCDAVHTTICSPASAAQTFKTSTAPEVLTAPVLSVGTPTATTAPLSWTALGGAGSDPVTYQVYLNDSLYQSPVTTTSLTVSGLTASTGYSVKVVGCDTTTNDCATSNTANFTTQNVPAGPTLSNVTLTAARSGANTIVVTGTATCTGGGCGTSATVKVTFDGGTANAVRGVVQKDGSLKFQPTIFSLGYTITVGNVHYQNAEAAAPVCVLNARTQTTTCP